jgi:hypothetical protein
MEPNSKPDVSKINKYAGKYRKKLLGELFLKSDISATMTVIKNVTAPRTFVSMKVKSGLRQLNTAIKSAKGGRDFTPETLIPRGAMKIIEVIPEEYRDTFLSEDLSEDDKKEPFFGFMLKQEFRKASTEYLNAFYYAKYVAPIAFDVSKAYSIDEYALFKDVMCKCIGSTSAGETPYSHPSKWLDVDADVILDGPDTVLKTKIAEGKIIPHATGSITGSNAVAALQTLFKAHSEPMRKTKMVVHHVSFDVFEKYIEDHNNRYGTGANNPSKDIDTDKAIILKGSAKRCKIQPCDWMGDSQRVISCPKAFLLFTTSNDPEHAGMSKVIEILHGYMFTIKHLTSFGFRTCDGVVVNDQD